MQFLFDSSIKTVFLTKKDSIKNLTSNINIILSPEYYWVKRVTLPISSLYRAKKLAPSIFREYLPKNDNYEYIVVKTDISREFIIIAYTKEGILKSLKKQVDDFKFIKAIYWTQIEFFDLSGCVGIDKNSSLSNVDDMILYLPTNCTNNKNLDELIKKTKLSKEHIKLNTLTSKSIPRKEVYGLFIALFLLIAAFALDSILHQYKAYKNEQKIENIQKKYSMPKTSFEIQNIQSKLKKIETKQKSLRKLLKVIDEIPQNSKTTLKSILWDKESLIIKIAVPDSSTKQSIKKFLTQNANIQKESFDNLIYTVRLTDE